MSGPVVTYRRDGNVGVITANNPPVNALGHAVREGLLAALAQAEADTAVEAIVIACAGRTFFAGADITEFGKPPKRPILGEVLARLENNAKPVVAALHGTALGIGERHSVHQDDTVNIPSLCVVPVVDVLTADCLDPRFIDLTLEKLRL